jgi:hypothetical protein
MTPSEDAASRGISRRDFVRGAALGAAALAAGGSALAAPDSAEAPVRVIHAYSASATRRLRPDAAVVKRMLTLGVRRLTGKDTLPRGLAAIFPGLRETDTIGLKVNWINGDVPTRPEVVRALLEGLMEMPLPGGKRLRPDHLIVWDQHDLTRLRELVNLDGPVFKSHWATGIDPDAVAPLTGLPPGKQIHFARTLTRECTYLINCPVLKNHAIGITGALKNHFGSIDDPGACHDDVDRHVADLNTAPCIRTKTRLIVLDALVGVYDGGPGGRPMLWKTQPDGTPNSLLLGTDPVAVDSVGFDWIQAEREHPAHGFTGHPACTHLELAAQRGLGVHERAPFRRIRVEQVTI